MLRDLKTWTAPNKKARGVPSEWTASNEGKEGVDEVKDGDAKKGLLSKMAPEELDNMELNELRKSWKRLKGAGARQR